MFCASVPLLSRCAIPASALLLLGACVQPVQIEETRQATGVKIGEVRQTSAALWARVTESQYRNSDGAVRNAGAAAIESGPFDQPDPRTLEGSAPGAPGRIRVRLGQSPDLLTATATDWADVDAESGFAHQFELTGLSPATQYYYAVDTTNASGSELHRPREGSFRTAPPPDSAATVTFAAISGLAYERTDNPEGFKAYNALARLQPDFLVVAGNTVYYDSDPLARNIELARYHWQRMYSLPTVLRFHLQFPAYWEKDDHDVYANDAWPGLKRPYMGTFTFEDGVKIYREQTPLRGLPYRSFRWGRLLQIWLTEGREFRSQNPMPDGPQKTIWGIEQKNWLKDTMSASDASWKILISPTPIVGPDRSFDQFDNHANSNWQTEGDEIRQYLSEHFADSLFIVCGDRTWQYHSVHPELALNEFSTGPASDAEASGSPGEDDAYHRFQAVEGGFLTVTVEVQDGYPQATLRHHNVDGQVVYEYTQRAKRML